jgi:hypothetical protein
MRTLLLALALTVASTRADADALTFTDDFSPPSTLWSNSVGNWTASGGNYYAQAPSNSPETISVLPFIFNNSGLSVTVTVNGLSDGGIRLDNDGTQNNGIVFVLGGNGYGGGNRSGGAGNSAYWALWQNGSSTQLLSEVDGVFTPGATYTITVLVNGNTYKAYNDPDGVFDANSILLTTLVDNTFSSGRVGLYDFYPTLSFSDFSVTGEISTVPWPRSIWAEMIFGFLGLGYMAYRQKNKSALAVA